MKQGLQKHLYISLGWLCVLLGAIGALLPLLPTTPFLILALLLFSKSSPRFHQMLLKNSWFGPALYQWETTRSISTAVKRKATWLIVVALSVSIYLLSSNLWLCLMLVMIAVILLIFIRGLRVS